MPAPFRNPRRRRPAIDIEDMPPAPKAPRYHIGHVSLFPGADGCNLCGGERIYQETVDVGIGHVAVAPEECLTCGAIRLDWRYEYCAIEVALGWSSGHDDDLPPIAVPIVDARIGRPLRRFAKLDIDMQPLSDRPV